MAEHEELQTIKPRMVNIEEQMAEIVAYLQESDARIEEKINQAVSRSYWKGFREGGMLGAFLGLGIGVWIAN